MPNVILNTLLTQAIREKRRVLATYDGHRREFCPHVLGYKDGVEVVLAYQFGGSSSKGPVAGEWKCFTVSNLKGIAITSGDWRIDSGNSLPRLQSCIHRAIEQVRFSPL